MVILSGSRCNNNLLLLPQESGQLVKQMDGEKGVLATRKQEFCCSTGAANLPFQNAFPGVF